MGRLLNRVLGFSLLGWILLCVSCEDINSLTKENVLGDWQLEHMAIDNCGEIFCIYVNKVQFQENDRAAFSFMEIPFGDPSADWILQEERGQQSITIIWGEGNSVVQTEWKVLTWTENMLEIEEWVDEGLHTIAGGIARRYVLKKL